MWNDLAPSAPHTGSPRIASGATAPDIAVHTHIASAHVPATSAAVSKVVHAEREGLHREAGFERPQDYANPLSVSGIRPHAQPRTHAGTVPAPVSRAHHPAIIPLTV
jgi:hypothetical protein